MRLEYTALLAATASALPAPLAHGLTAIGLGGLVHRPSPALNIGLRLPRVHTVVVGGPQDTFIPNTVHAAVGDVVQFQFSSGNHTVTQSSETEACQPLQATHPGAIHSGHIPFQAGQTTVGVFSMPVTSTGPMFLYCATGPHCLEGQVMVVNPTSADQLVRHARLALGAPANIDGTVVSGGVVGQIPIEAAAFDQPPPEEEGGGPPGGAPPAEQAPPAGEAPAEEAPAEEAPAETPAEEAPAEEAPAEEAPAETPAAEAPVEEAAA